jgi:site-specific DNA-methyltransferase (adenine-specific)
MILTTVVNQIKQGDCVALLGELSDDSVDLTLTSPPYDQLRKYGGDTFDFESLARELYRVTKPGGVIVWIVADATVNGSETGTSFKQALFFQSLGLNLHDTMVFLKRNPVPQIYRKRYTNEFEYMFVLSKGPVRVHNPLTTPCLHAGKELVGTTYKNYSAGNQKRGKKASPVRAEKQRGNVWAYVVGKNKEDQEAKSHPAPFPMALARDHILSWSNPGDLVLDPLCGSGTTCKAASQLGRKFLGFEINTDYCSLAKQRLSYEEAKPE